MIERILRRTQHFFTHMLRDRRGLPALLFVPVGLLMLLGWVMKGTDVDVTIAVVREGDHWAVSDIATEMEEIFELNDATSIRVADQAAAEQAVRDGDADGYIIVDEAFAGAVLGGEEDDVRVGVAGDNAAVEAKTLREIGRAVVQAPLRVLRESTGGEPVADGEAVELTTAYIYGDEGYDSFDQLLPAALAFLIFLTIFTSSMVFISNDRGLHTLERVMATPLRRWEYVAGAALGYLTFALLQAISVMLVAEFLLDVSYAGSIASILIVAAAVALCGVAIAVFFSAFARSESEAMQMLPVALIPQFIICGVLFPLSAMPEALQQVARFLPVTYGVEALGDVMLRGYEVTDPSVVANLAVLMGFTAVFAVLGTRALQPEEQ
jgi:ABC-2 type transport system permease protein